MVTTGQTGKQSQEEPDALAAYCGLYCGACSIWIGSREDPKRLVALATRFGVSVEEMQCDGCRSERRMPYCQSCQLAPCVRRRGHEFCSECEDYPCEDLRAFQSEYPHRLELWRSLDMIRDRGWQAWEEDMKERFACPSCGVINSAYDLRCRACGHSPGSRFAEEHEEAIRSSPEI